jgi:hypothetical protein
MASSFVLVVGTGVVPEQYKNIRTVSLTSRPVVDGNGYVSVVYVIACVFHHLHLMASGLVEVGRSHFMFFVFALDASWNGQCVAVVDHVSDGEVLSESVLILYARWLRPGGELVFMEKLGSDAEMRLLMSGFVDVHAEVVDANRRKYIAKKPAWDGTAQKLSLPKTTAWKLDDGDLLEDDLKTFNKSNTTTTTKWAVNTGDDLEDEDALLDAITSVGGPQDLAALVATGEDCSTSKRACKNCVCGRGTTEAVSNIGDTQQSLVDRGVAQRTDAAIIVDTTKLAVGACGSCSLGDAFRCAGCPSKGLPAYTVGEKVVIRLE